MSKKARKAHVFFRTSLPETTPLLDFCDHTDASNMCAVSKLFLQCVLHSFAARPFPYVNGRRNCHNYNVFKSFLEGGNAWSTAGLQPKEWTHDVLMLPKEPKKTIQLHFKISKSIIIAGASRKTLTNVTCRIFAKGCRVTLRNLNLTLTDNLECENGILEMENVAINHENDMIRSPILYLENARARFVHVTAFVRVVCRASFVRAEKTHFRGLFTHLKLMNSYSELQDCHMAVDYHAILMWDDSKLMVLGNTQIWSRKKAFVCFSRECNVALIGSECLEKYIDIKNDRITRYHTLPLSKEWYEKVSV